MKIQTIWLFLLSFLMMAGAGSSSQDEKLDKILDKMEKRYQTTQAIFCRYKQTERISQLTEDIFVEGKLYFRKPHFIMMEMRGDENLNLYVNGENIWIEDLDLDEVEIFDFQQMNKNRRLARLLPPMFLQSVQELKEWFHISLLPIRGKNRLELRPRSQEEFHFESIRFDVGRWGKVPWMKVTYDEENFKEISFRDWQKIPVTSKYFFQYRGKTNPKKLP